MNRYLQTFTRLKASAEIAFIPFSVAADPDIKTSEEIFKTYVDNGADILEIGYPFSDPIADGPVNQRAAQRALAAGLTHDSFFALISRLRRYTDIPMGLLAYANSLYHLGYEQFCSRASSAGLDSILVADMPPEEAEPLLTSMQKYSLQTVFIISELTPLPRLKMICSKVNGFVYVVSRLGTTGFNSFVTKVISKLLRNARVVTNKPLCVGFGISKPEHIRLVKGAGADGAIVGSALVRIIESTVKQKREMLKCLAREVVKYKNATRG